MGLVKHWSLEEIEYLEEKWGESSIPSIARHLGRSITGVKKKANKLGLERFTHQGEYVTFHHLMHSIGQLKNYTNINRKLERYGFPVKYKTMINSKVKIVYIEDFWNWAEANQTKIDFSNFEENMLGPEPDWVKRKRFIDKKRKSYKTSAWSEQEDRWLKQELNKYKYTYDELSRILNRTPGAIQKRIWELGLLTRPIESEKQKWTEHEENKLKDMIKNRFTYEIMGDELGRSSKSVRRKVYRMYSTENLDKAAKLIV